MGPGGMVLMMSQRTCWALLPGAAEAKVVRSISAAPNAKTVPSTQNRLLRFMLPPLPLVHSSVDADLAVQDLLRWQNEDERCEQRQLKRSNPGAARSHFDMKCGRRFPLVARLEHAGAAEARAARCHGGACHLTPDGHQREARKLRRPGRRPRWQERARKLPLRRRAPGGIVSCSPPFSPHRKATTHFGGMQLMPRALGSFPVLPGLLPREPGQRPGRSPAQG